MSLPKLNMNRRKFLQLAAASAPAASLAGAQPIMARSNADDPVTTPSTKDNTVRIGAIQTSSSPYVKGLNIDPFSPDFKKQDIATSVNGWLRWYEELLDQAAAEKLDLVVLTEDITRISHLLAYLDDRSIFQDIVKQQTPLIAERLSAVARKKSMYIVACYFAWEDGKIYNVADLFGPKGELVGRYRKVHLPQYELWQVTAGNEFPAFETDLGWISMLICYDQMWPEAASCCAMNGAQIICQPSAASLKDYQMRTRAKDNQVHFISSTWNASMITSPKADILANAQGENPGIIWADVDVQNATKAPDYFWETLYSGIRDHKERHLNYRRPETYGVLTEQHPPLAQQYPQDNRANTPDAIERVYNTLKEMKLKRINGEKVPYHWHW